MTFADDEFADPGFGALRAERDELLRVLRLVTKAGSWEVGEWDNVLEIANATVEKFDSRRE